MSSPEAIKACVVRFGRYSQGLVREETHEGGVWACRCADLVHEVFLGILKVKRSAPHLKLEMHLDRTCCVCPAETT